MAYTQDSPMHRSLTDEEEAEFRAYAQANDPPDLANWNLYHPVCREEWLARGIVPPPMAVNALTGEMESTDPACHFCGAPKSVHPVQHAKDITHEFIDHGVATS